MLQAKACERHRNPLVTHHGVFRHKLWPLWSPFLPPFLLQMSKCVHMRVRAHTHSGGPTSLASPRWLPPRLPQAPHQHCAPALSLLPCGVSTCTSPWGKDCHEEADRSHWAQLTWLSPGNCLGGWMFKLRETTFFFFFPKILVTSCLVQAGQIS